MISKNSSLCNSVKLIKMNGHQKRRREKPVNQHYLYINTGYAYPEQVISALTETLVRHNAKTKFKVSLVTVKGKTCGYAYVWIEKKDIFIKLTGTDSEGNKRVKYIPDKTWRKPYLPLEEALAKFELEDVYDKDNWADYAEHEDDIEEIRKSYYPRTIEVAVDSDFKLPKYTYYEEQEKHINLSYLDDSPEHGAFVVGAAHIPKKKPTIQQHVIFCNRVPTWITMDQLKTMFSPFASDYRTLHKKQVKRKIVTDTYPFIAINTSSNNTRNQGRRGRYRNCRNGRNDKYNVVYVTFDKTTIDGKMALLVCRKMVVVDPSNVNRSTTLIFNHPKKAANRTTFN